MEIEISSKIIILIAVFIVCAAIVWSVCKL
jgi:hypothetical protein